MDRVAALVLAGGRGVDFGPLSETRTKAAFPIAGGYRIIDFVLSNLSHSNVRQVGIIIQFLPAPLIEHIGSGRPWDYDMADRGLRIMTPFVGISETRWFNGTADAIAKNINLVAGRRFRDILILSGEHAYQMDYRPLIERHRESDADLTIACVLIPPERQHPRFGNVVADQGGRVEQFIEKPVSPVSPLVSTGIYCFRREKLLELLERFRPPAGEPYSLTGDLIHNSVGGINAQAWMFDRPWHYIGNLAEFWEFHMGLADGRIRLFNSSWNVVTNFSDRGLASRPPAIFAPGCQVEHSIISPGCLIEGRVSHSVLSPGVHIGKGGVVSRSVVFHDARIGEGASIDHAVVDKEAIIENGARVGGWGDDPAGEGPPPLTVLPKQYRVESGRRVAAGATFEMAARIP